MPEAVLDARTTAKVAAALRRIFGPGALAAPSVVETAFGRRPAWRIEDARSSSGAPPPGAPVPLGFALADEVPGKSERITILVAVGLDGRLKDLEILAYRESYGGEVAQESWRAQFRGRKAGEPLRVGRQIRNIAGATISTNSVSAGVSRCLPVLARLAGARQ